MKYMKKHCLYFLLWLIAGFVCCPISAQRLRYDEKIELSCGLTKVKSNNRYGLLDADGRLKLPVEFQDIVFREGRALIIHFGSNHLYGYVDSLGVIKHFKKDYFLNMNYPYFSYGFICVTDKAIDGKWGYINYDEKSLSAELSALKSGIFVSKKIKGKFIFDFAAPFSEGYASVYAEKAGWHHIDIYGHERFILDKPSKLRTTVYQGESLIYTEDGVKIYEEDENRSAGVKIHIAENTSDLYYALTLPTIAYSDNYKTVAILDTLFRAEKIGWQKPEGADSIVFIAPPVIEPEIVEPIDSFTLTRDIIIEVNKTTVGVNAKGKVTISMTLTNKGDFDSKELYVNIQCNGSTKTWHGILLKGETEEISMVLSARISVPRIKRKLEWEISVENQQMNGEENIIINRYRPAR